MQRRASVSTTWKYLAEPFSWLEVSPCRFNLTHYGPLLSRRMLSAVHRTSIDKTSRETPTVVKRALSTHVPRTVRENRIHELLPTRWYCDEKVYALERRAIFSNHWHVASFIGRFQNSGDYLNLEMHGWSFFLIKDEHKNINAFHNICRHRGHPIMLKDAGCSKRLVCKYHGWSYKLCGALDKARKYDQFDDFDASKHSLFKIHTHVTPQGFIFVNFDSSETPRIAFESQFGDHFNVQPSLEVASKHTDDDYANLQPAGNWIYDNTWKSSSLGTMFNWKTYADGFQECYHCPTGHASTLPHVLDLDNYHVRQGHGAARHLPTVKPGVPEEFGQFYITWLFPLGAIVYTDNMLFISRFNTTGASRTNIQHETFRSKDIPESGSRHVAWLEDVDGWRHIEGEDIELCQSTQKGFKNGVFDQGRLHPVEEHAVIWYQDKVRRLLIEHAKLEIESRRQIDYSIPLDRGTVPQPDPLKQLLDVEMESSM